MRSLSLVVLAALGLLVACADGGDTDGGQGGAGASTSSGEGGDDSTVASTTTTTTSASSGQGGGGGEGGEGGGGEGGAGGEACSFSAPNSKANPVALGQIAGEGGGSVSHQATTTKFVKVYVKETVGGLTKKRLGYEAKLEVPAGMSYDLFVHQGPQDASPNDDPDCFVTPLVGAGDPKTVTSSWDDQQGIFGEDDSLWLCIEVRYVSGDMCTDPWTLTVTGTG